MKHVAALLTLLGAVSGSALADDFATALPQHDAGAFQKQGLVARVDNPWTIGDYVAAARLEHSGVVTISRISIGGQAIDEAARRL